MEQERRQEGCESRVFGLHALRKVATVHHAYLKHEQDDHKNHTNNASKQAFQDVDKEKVGRIPASAK